MNVRKMVEKYIKDNGFGGLYNEEEECACSLDVLMGKVEDGGICDLEINRCKPGYKHIAPIGSDYDYIISPDKEASDEG